MSKTTPPRPPSKKKVKPERQFSVIPSTTMLIVGFFVSVIGAMILAHIVVQPKINAEYFDLGEPIKLEGVLSVNDRLGDHEILLEDQVFGPECLAINEKNGLLYTGLKTGLICEIDTTLKKPRILRAVRLTSVEECDGSYGTMAKCGRPLGLRFNPHGELLVIDAYLGLYAISWDDEKTVKVLGAGELPINDDNAPPVRYLNDFDFLPDGRIILSESSTKFDDRDCIYDIFEHKPNGRLLIYDPRKKDLRVLKDGLYFPNGVQVALEKGVTKDDPIRVFYSEMGMARIMTIWVPIDPYSKKPIRTKVLVDNLPGYPDNIRLTKKGQLLVPIPAQRTNDDRYVEKMPHVREYLTKIFSPQLFNWIGQHVSNSNGLLLKVNIETGQIIESYHDSTGKIQGITTAIDEGNEHMLLGNDANYYIARVKM